MPKVRIDEPITVPGVANPHGATVLPLKDYLRERKRRNRPPKTREELEYALAAHDRVKAACDEMRARNGLPPLKDGLTAEGWRAKLAEAPKRKAAAKRQAELTPAQRVSALAKRKRDLEREREAVDAEVRELVTVAKVSEIAKALGVSRQRVYQLAGSC